MWKKLSETVNRKQQQQNHTQDKRHLNCAQKRKLWIEFLILHTWHSNINTQKLHDFIIYFFFAPTFKTMRVKYFFREIKKTLQHFRRIHHIVSLMNAFRNIKWILFIFIIYFSLFPLFCSENSSKTCRRRVWHRMRNEMRNNN